MADVVMMAAVMVADMRAAVVAGSKWSEAPQTNQGRDHGDVEGWHRVPEGMSFR